MPVRKPPSISIGADKVIPLADIDGRQCEAVELDVVVMRLEAFWILLETECVAECCGLDAFRFWPENVRATLLSLEQETVLAHLKELKALVEKSSSGVFVSERLNQYIDRTALLQLIDHLIECLVAGG